MKIERDPHEASWAVYVEPPDAPRTHPCIELYLNSPNNAEARLSWPPHYAHWCVYITLRGVYTGSCCAGGGAEEAHG